MHKLRLAPARRPEPRVHAPRLEIARGRNAGDFPVRVLPRQPRFDVIGPPRTEPHVARAQHHRAIGDAQPLQQVLTTAQHAFLFVVAGLRMNDRHHFHLLELVLAQHARRILARTARFRPEAQGVRRHPDWQSCLFQDIPRH